jgi:DNA sulfur modification protein DndC
MVLSHLWQISLSRVEEAFRALDEAYLKYKTFILAFSGGKDSTVASILFYRWVKERGVRPLVVLIHNDTLSEIPEMEQWVRYFVDQFLEKARQLGLDVRLEYAAPHPTETWYWRVFVRGYPASTFSFRWCVDLLKIEPTARRLRRYPNAVLVVGSRDEESAARSKSMAARFGSCMSNASCLGAYITQNNDIPKVAPIRFWTLEEVWHFLRRQTDFDVSPLFRLYWFPLVRYGCWHCTLVKTQWANHLDPKYKYAEAVRRIYKAVSDTPELRTPKNTGYSRLGPLNALGRSIVFNTLWLAVQKAGIDAFYGLKMPVGGYTLWQLLYELPPEKADRIIAKIDNTERRIPIRLLRELRSHEGWREALDKLKSKVSPEALSLLSELV